MLDFFMDNFYTCNDLLNTPIRDLEFTVLDFETTGLYPFNGDRIVEFGMVRANSARILKTFTSLINPRRPIPEAVTKINHITDEMVKDSPLIEAKIDQLVDFMKNSVVVGQNLNFDISFLNYQLQSMGKPKIDLWMVDTLKVAKVLLPHLERFSLEHITKELKIRNKESHRALADTEATAKVLHAFIKRLPPGSVLKDLLAYKAR